MGFLSILATGALCTKEDERELRGRDGELERGEHLEGWFGAQTAAKAAAGAATVSFCVQRLLLLSPERRPNCRGRLNTRARSRCYARRPRHSYRPSVLVRACSSPFGGSVFKFDGASRWFCPLRLGRNMPVRCGNFVHFAKPTGLVPTALKSPASPHWYTLIAPARAASRHRIGRFNPH